jgi:hypothetical protein
VASQTRFIDNVDYLGYLRVITARLDGRERASDISRQLAARQSKPSPIPVTHRASPQYSTRMGFSSAINRCRLSRFAA